MKKLFFVLFFVLFMALASTVQAIPITGVFSGSCESVWGPDELLNEIGVGTKFVGLFSYDSDAPIIYDFGDGSYAYSTPFQIEYIINGKSQNYHLIGSNSDVVAGNYSFRSDFIMNWNGSIAGYFPDEGSINLNGVTCNSLPVDFDDFISGGIWIENYGWPGYTFEIHGKINCLKAGPVPEPSTILLMTSGIFAIAGWRKKLFTTRFRKNYHDYSI